MKRQQTRNLTVLAWALAQVLPTLAAGGDSTLAAGGDRTPSGVDDPAAVVVTASRFAERAARFPASISVIDRDDLRRSPALNLPDLLAERAGIQVRPLYGRLGLDSTVDLRGFGESATGNTLVLLDGQRLNPVDGAGLDWSTIPLGAVERIEILRGAGTVLYGDRAVGGVINIVTDRSATPRGHVEAGAGSHGYRSLDAGVAGGASGLSYNLAARHAESDGYRRNNQSDQDSVAGRVGLANGRGDVFVDFAAYRNSSGLPSSLLSADYREDPRRARTPHDWQARNGFRVRPGVVAELTPELSLEAELGLQRDDDRYRSPGFATDRDRETSFLTPRLRWRHGLGARASDTVFGLDAYRSDVSNRFSGTVQQASQDSTALYAQNTTAVATGTDLTLGVRSQRLRQEAREDSAFSALRGEATRSRNAWELGLSQRLTDASRVWGRVGRVFRFPHTDELFGFNPVTFEPTFRGDLRPQQGGLAEVGANWRGAGATAAVSAYGMRLKDEIGFDSDSFENVNFPATRRHGLDAEATWKPLPALALRVAYAWTRASFRDGPNAGREIPLVPRHQGSASASWDAAAAGLYTARVNAVGSRWYGGDLANARGKLAGHATVDLMASWNLRPWTVGLRLLNALDKRYAPYAGWSSFRNDFFYFPADARSLFVTARYDFR